MKLISNKISKIFLISTLSCLIYIHTQTIAANQQITVDVNNVIADVYNNPVGINLNFLLDEESAAIPFKELKLGSLRYPMGEIADYYLFDRNKPTQPKISIRDSSVWFANFTNTDGTWKNSLNFDQFVTVCRSVNAEPFVVIGIDALAYTGNSPHATSEEVLQAAVDWVEYANVIQRYQIKYWEIGNETDLSSAHLNWTAKDYAETVVRFSQALKKVDPSIEIGVNGMTGSTWWDKVMPIVNNNVDFLVTHQYSSMQSYKQWKSNDWNYTSNIETAKQAIETYNPILKLNVTENSSFNPGKSHFNNIWKMLHNFEMLGNILYIDKVDYFHFWTSRWLEKKSYSEDFSAFDANYQLMPMGYPLKIWGNFLKQKMVYSSKSGPVGSWASYAPDDNSLNVFLLNKNKIPQNVNIKLDNYTESTQNERWVLKGSTPESTNVTWNKFGSVSVSRSKIKTKLEPLSVTVIAFQASRTN
ncbi:hypothetical protein [Pleurocapsa sp. PCC 7319]|uniref:hypothetical protein n=1 Tax=Pleurocapsa sp. PCC 7319 TaxID=118161 RepID=UPI000344E59E|nr:hypothetical protein [Pleurocapsa sp. PCC 7319]